MRACACAHGPPEGEVLEVALRLPLGLARERPRHVLQVRGRVVGVGQVRAQPVHTAQVAGGKGGGGGGGAGGAGGSMRSRQSGAARAALAAAAAMRKGKGLFSTRQGRPALAPFNACIITAVQGQPSSEVMQPMPCLALPRITCVPFRAPPRPALAAHRMAGHEMLRSAMASCTTLRLKVRCRGQSHGPWHTIGWVGSRGSQLAACLPACMARRQRP